MTLKDRVEKEHENAIYRGLLTKFKDDVRSNPNADFSSYIQAFAAELVKAEKRHEKSMVRELLLALYAKNSNSLRQALCRLEMPNAPSCPRASRTMLLQSLYDGILSSYIDSCADIEAAGGGLTFQELKREHPGRICICLPSSRGDDGRVDSWLYLRAVKSVATAKENLALLELKQVKDAVAISTTGRIAIEGELAEKYSRVFFGTEQ